MGNKSSWDTFRPRPITESRPLKHVGRKKWGTQDALRAHKGLPLFLVRFDFKKPELPKGSPSQSFGDNGSN